MSTIVVIKVMIPLHHPRLLKERGKSNDLQLLRNCQISPATVHWTVIFLILWKSALEDSFSVKCYWQKKSVDYFQKKTKDNNH